MAKAKLYAGGRFIQLLRDDKGIKQAIKSLNASITVLAATAPSKMIPKIGLCLHYLPTPSPEESEYDEVWIVSSS